jgi:hypothetical protein
VRFGMQTLLALVTMVALACAVLFVAPPIVRVAALFVAVSVMPAPLLVLLRHGGREIQTFALGSLVGYATWLVLGGLPCAAMVAYRFMRGSRQDIKTQTEYIIDGYYASYVGLYAPWIIVPLAGAIALIVHWLMQDRGSD